MTLVVTVGLLFQWRSTRRIQELSHRDGLSGLYNRNYTFSYLEKVIPRINVDSGSLSVILGSIINHWLTDVRVASTRAGYCYA